MDKKTTMINALKYLNIEMLYGTIAGQTVKDYLLSDAENIIKGDWSPEETAAKIKYAMKNEDTEEPLYKPAYERAVLPMGAVLDITEEDKKNYIEAFIQGLPYSGEIQLGPTYKANIADKLREKIRLMQDDYTVLYDFDGNTRPLTDEYRLLLNNEYKDPNIVDKLDIIMEGVRRLRKAYPDYDAIAELTIDGKTFAEAIKDLPERMDDHFRMNDSFGEELATDYMYKVFKRYAEARYNSVNSKPTNVETIKIGRNEENKEEATSEYIFMSEEQVDSMTKESEPDETRIRANMLNILEGIRIAKSIDALEQYEEMIASAWDEAKSTFPDNESFGILYVRMLDEYTAKQKELTMIKDNEDDAEIFLRNELVGIKNRIEGIKTDFTHTYENPEKEFEDVRYEFFKFRDKAESMNARMHHEIQDVEDLIRAVYTRIQYSMDNVNHMVRAKHQELDDLMSEAYFAFRRLDNSLDYREKAACQTKCEELARELERKLEDDFKEGFITDSDYENYLHDMNNKLYSRDMEPIRRRY